jgi:chemotaxis methyl-accepting protein methylase
MEKWKRGQAQLIHFAGKPPGGLVRVWVCGCSTGEEAYTIAILLQEHLDTLKQPYKVQIFATDVDGQAIERARSGIFPASIAADVSPERLTRFFPWTRTVASIAPGKPSAICWSLPSRTSSRTRRSPIWI